MSKFDDRKFAQFEQSRRAREQGEKRYSLSDYFEQIVNYSYNGVGYNLPANTTYGNSRQEPIGNDFVGYVQGAYKRNGIVFAAVLARCILLSEARFKFRSLVDKKLIGSQALLPLERPDTNMTTGELIFRAEQDDSLAGNFYVTNRYGGARRMRPDLVDIIISGSEKDPQYDLSAELAGYAYWSDGRGRGRPEYFLPREVAHWSPNPDPECRFRGMSWLQPIATEITSDLAATAHKQKFFENGATVNLAIQAPDWIKNTDQLLELKEKFDDGHKGVNRAYETLWLAAGADVKTIGADLAQIDFKQVQGAGETRIAVASRVGAPILGISEGLGGSSLNAGNLAVARRLFADGWGRSSWRSLCAALSPLVTVPSGFELWYDTADVAFLREDEKDAAQIAFTEAQAIRQLTDGGYEPASVVAAVKSRDMSLLKHTGLLSVQMQAPGAEAPIPAA